MNINIENYFLTPLTHIEKGDIGSFLGSGTGVYICEGASQEWRSQFNLTEIDNITHYEKKKLMFSQMAEGSIWINPVSKLPKARKTKKWQHNKIIYLANHSLPWRFDQILQTIYIFLWLLKNSKHHEYYLVYNFDIPFFIGVLAAKIFLRKMIYVDYEDDYTKKETRITKKLTELLLRKTITGAVCINKNMANSLPQKRTIVHNAFADLEYMQDVDFTFKEGMTFLYSGTLDDIRGVDLIPKLIHSIKKHINKFSIIITGRGPLENIIKSWHHEEVIYLGFLDRNKYIEVIKRSDICLILQKPDHPFNSGSFPSKVEDYSKYRKPIMILKKNEETYK